MSSEAPSLIDNSRVLESADVQSLAFSGADPIFLDHQPVGRVPRLAICECIETSETFLHRCNLQWASIAVSIHASVGEARARAEKAYPGVDSIWRRGAISHQEALALRREQWGDVVCSRCGRTPDSFDSLETGASGELLCNECLSGGRS